MKQIKFALLFLSLVPTRSQFFAQSSKSESGNCVGKGSFIVDAYYGAPYVLGKYLKDESVNSKTSNSTKVTNLNHIGAKFEFMINKMVGIGLDYTYARVSGTYIDTYYENVNGTYISKTGTFQSSLTKQRVLARVNIHFATTSVLDPYATAGIGYKVSLLKENNPNINQRDVDDLNATLNIIPVAFRLGVGLRYYFIPNLGICAEAGIGGPIFQAGITGKF